MIVTIVAAAMAVGIFAYALVVARRGLSEDRYLSAHRPRLTDHRQPPP